MSLYGIGGTIVAERIERKRGLWWLIAKLRHQPVRFKVIERIATGRAVTTRRPL